jgi:hypothetical protein
MKITPLAPIPSKEEPLYVEAQIKVFLRAHLRKEFWSLLDACLLVHQLNPHDSGVQRLALRDELPPEVKRFRVLLDAAADHELKTVVIKGIRRITPKDFLKWLEFKKIQPPELFVEMAFAALNGRPLTGNQLRKQNTQKKYEAWNNAYAELLSLNPRLSKSSASQQIAKSEIGKGNDSETIRRHLRQPSKKVGR